MTDTHRCLADTKCRDPDTTDGTRQGAHTEQPDTLCDPCLAHIANCCRQLPKDWTELHEAIGERGTGTGIYVRSTPTPAIPISITKEALMVEIVDLADLAAALISDCMDISMPTDRRRLPPRFTYEGEVIEPAMDSVARTAAEIMVRPDDLQRLNMMIALVHLNIDKLVKICVQPMLIWDKHHEGDWGQPATQWEKIASARYVALDGHGRIFIERSGLDIALNLVDVHNRVRAELGKTRLRHKYTMPCPLCGSDVGRDDGDTVITCNNKDCGASWTEREYKLHVGLIAEGSRMDILKYLLAEGYARLDNIQDLIDKLSDDERINVPGSAVALLLDELHKIMDGHTPPKKRAIATKKSEAEQRQVIEDSWSWSGEKIYRPPKRKQLKPYGSTGLRIAASSLTVVSEDPTYNGENENTSSKCPDCQLIHQGECP